MRGVLALALILALPVAFQLGALFGEEPPPEHECLPVLTVSSHPPDHGDFRNWGMPMVPTCLLH